jgi:hypothetical protein
MIFPEAGRSARAARGHLESQSQLLFVEARLAESKSICSKRDVQLLCFEVELLFFEVPLRKRAVLAR